MLSLLLATIVPTFGIIGVGWLCRRTGIWERGAVRALNGYAYYIALPALIFDAVLDLDLAARITPTDVRFILGLLAGHLVVALLALPLLAPKFVRREVRAVGPMLLTFGSTAYLGIPFATYAFGETGTAYAALGSVVLVVALLFVSLAVLNRYGRREEQTATWHQLLELPFLWAVVLGIALPVIGVRALPIFLDRTIAILAGSAGPTALLAIGAFEYDLKLRGLPWGWSTVLGVGKVLLPTVASFVILALLGVSGIPLAVGTALAATSVAVTAFVLADEYRIGRELTAGALFTSTFASLVALSVITWLWAGTGVFR